MVARRRLGRGLDGLLPSAPPPQADAPANHTAAIEELQPSSRQPRRTFDEVALEELATSIREHGVLEPILVRTRNRGGFEIIAGERRWRAAQRAGLHEVPIFVHELGDTAAFEAALVENLQREDLNPVEMARAFQHLLEDCNQTQEDIAAKVGKDRSTVANALRLLKLPEEVLGMVESGELSEGHGRALLTAPSVGAMRKLALQATRNGWSVRETERQARKGKSNGQAPSTGSAKSANVRDLERRLSKSLGATVTVQERAKGKGHIQIAYSGYDELDGLIAKLTK